MTHLSNLVCGSVRKNDAGALAQSLRHFSETFGLLETGLKKQKSNKISTPFMVRSIMELACTGIVARIDPFRILTLGKIQGQATYDASEKVSSALQWQGDVVDKKVNDLWVTSRKASEMTRAMLGDYQDEVFWQPAFYQLLDYIGQTGSDSNDPWLTELINIDPSALIPRFRGTAMKIYSTASKGIHHEFVLSISSYYDTATLEGLVEDTIRLAATLALIVNFSECALYKLSPKRAITNYKAMQL